MKRREFITLLGGAAAAWPLAARAQQAERVRRIGVLWGVAPESSTFLSYRMAFTQTLREAGWTEERNVTIDHRWSVTDLDRLRTYGHRTGGAGTRCTRWRFHTFDSCSAGTDAHDSDRVREVADPLGSGFVESFARPGHNATGISNHEVTMGGKWVELLKEIVPSVARVALIYNPRTAPFTVSYLHRSRAPRACTASSSSMPPWRPRRIGNGRCSASSRTGWKFGRADRRICYASSGFDHLIGRASPVTRDLSGPFICGSGRSSVLRQRFHRDVPKERRPTSTASCEALRRPTFRCKHRASLSLRLTSRPPRLSASPFRRRCSPAPTR